MKDVAGLMHLAFKLTHEVSEAGLDLGQAPSLRKGRSYSRQITDSGVSALAQVAAASAIFPSSDYGARMEAARALRGAREDLRRFKDSVKRAVAAGQIAPDCAELLTKVDELTVILMALAIEVRGNSLAA